MTARLSRALYCYLMESYSLAISMAILGLFAWDVARRFFALQVRKLATSDEIELLNQRAVQLAGLVGESDKNAAQRDAELAARIDAIAEQTATNDRVAEIEGAAVAMAAQFSDDAEKMGKRVGELDDKMAKIISGTVQKGPRKMILGGIR